ncbi:relA-associated inhibitor isoform X2 [Thalassophryne amazonica]|uniref:relA-associated inhibitor isoform X2 n=1 Tax=Thalassophryne amazonica TaxID=390379 RepID=UPI0014715C08|nr:relA-associated inhibitor isoform X2 [Thalassophryne amazonica]
MSSQTSLGSSMLFQSINDDLNASLATADELSREFNSLLTEASSSNNKKAASETISLTPWEKPQSDFPKSPVPKKESGTISNGSSMPYSPTTSSSRPYKSVTSSDKNTVSPTAFSTTLLLSPNIRTGTHSPLSHIGSDSYNYDQISPKQSPHSRRRNSPSRYDRSPRGSISYVDSSPSPSATPTSPQFPLQLSPRSQRRTSNYHYDQSPRGSISCMDVSPAPSPTSVSSQSALYPSSNLLTPYDNSQMGRRSPRRDRSPSPLSLNYPAFNSLSRNSGGFRQPDDVHRQKSPGKWSETDLDMAYERKPHHTQKTERVWPSVSSSSWRESNLDGPPAPPGAKKDPRSQSAPYSYGSLARNTFVTDGSSPVHSPYHPQPIISRIPMPPVSPQSRQHKPIPLSLIMRLQDPTWGMPPAPQPRAMGDDDNMLPYQPAGPFPREFHQPVQHLQPHPPETRQQPLYSEVLKPGDVDAEVEQIGLAYHMTPESPSTPEGSMEKRVKVPRPLSPTRLQPVLAPEAQKAEIPNVEELLRIRAEIPRALKRRSSEDQSLPLKKASQYEPNQYKFLINKLFHRRACRRKAERGSDSSSSSDDEDTSSLPVQTPPMPPPSPHDYKLPFCFSSQNYHSILRPTLKRPSSGRRARLSPLVLLLDGALVGELEIVQKAVQEMQDPSQPNDEGITALHNAICGGHYKVVEFLVGIGANVSAPDSHGWTPLHCAASCNDRPLCEFLVRNGAAVMAMTESNGATAAQMCDPYAVRFEECESFLRGMEDAMGVENSGVLYAVWSYPAQMADELSFKEGDMVTILQKPEGSDWWWASLCGREGFVPNNYFGLFPKVRPKSLC